MAFAWVGWPGANGSGWLALGPAYAHLLVILARPLIPVIETTPVATYWVEGATVWTTRTFFDPATRRPVVLRVEQWKGNASYGLILLAALILATPGWSLRERGRLLALGLALLTLAEFAFFLSTIEYSRLRHVTTRTGSVLFPADFSRPKEILATWVYYFFQTMGRVLFPLLVYLGMVGTTWRPVDKRAPQRAPVRAPGRNAPCPCGSGEKYKACCGKA